MLDATVTTGLVLNATLLLALVVTAVLVPERHGGRRLRWSRQVLVGAVVAAFGVGVMLIPVVLRPGVAFDVRSVLLSLSGLFFGAVPTSIAVVATAGLRWAQGGVGAWPGIGVILVSGAIGVGWHRWRRDGLHRLGGVELYLFGLVVHVAMIAVLRGLPQSAWEAFVSEALVPLLLLYPLLTVLVGRLLVQRAGSARALERLKASEERFRTLYEHGHAVMLVVDPSDGAIVDANASAAAFYGWRTDELRAMRIGQINTLTPDEIQDAMAKARGAGRASFEFRHRLADGSVREVEVFSGPIDVEGRPLLYSLVVDVQERRDAEAARRAAVEVRARESLEEVEHQQRARRAALDLAEDAQRVQRELAAALERLELLIEHAPVAVALFDRDMRYTAVSRRYLTDYELEGVDLIGRRHYDVFPDLSERFRASHARALQGEVVRSDDDRIVEPDGRVVWKRWEVRPWRDEHGAIGGIVLFVEDVTEAMRAQEQVVKLSAAVEQSPESIVITNTAAEIEYVNDAFVAATGFSREELIGRNPRVLNSGKTPRSTYRAMWDALATGATWRGEFHNRRKDGSEYVEFATVSAITGSDGAVTHYVAVKEDVTEKKRIGQELDRYRFDLESLVAERTVQLEAARERAEAADRAKSLFLANMSHEIRTPLNAVVGLTHLLQRDHPSARQRERLAKIDVAAAHLLSIISDVLDLAKIEAGQASLDVRDFHLAAVLDQVRSMIAAAAKAKGLVVEVDEDSVPQWLRGDPTRIRQALLNLAGNAVKFTETGTVWLRAKILERKSNALRVRFEVEDTGIGIAPEALERLFAPFEQGDASVTRRFGGTGLGLAITRELAMLMGGETGVESAPNAGTRIWFTVELETGHGVMPPREVALLGDGGAIDTWRSLAGARVLLAEDHPINREVAVEMLSSFGLDVVTAVDGLAAVERAREGMFDAVLMDMQMPVMGGIEATRAIRALPGYASVPIFAVSANVFDEDRRACFDAGMSDFVAKPIDPKRLAETLSRWLEARARVASDGWLVRPSAPATVTVGGPWWSGLDAEVGLEAVGGDPQRLAGLLRRLVRAHANDARLVRDELERNDREAASRRLHALSGAASTLGVVRLHDVAARLSRALRDYDAVPDPFVDALEEALEDLTASLPPPDAESTEVAPAVAALSAREVLAQLAALLDADDPDAGAWLSKRLAVLRPSLGSDVDRLADAVERFDFASARETVAQLEARL